ncbi:MAG: SPOR domain-containing protein [Hyphomicrobiaceae bacterium]|nr:SPOR domain-containing protein [Hyphomicrobiaceae bacterium]
MPRREQPQSYPPQHDQGYAAGQDPYAQQHGYPPHEQAPAYPDPQADPAGYDQFAQQPQYHQHPGGQYANGYADQQYGAQGYAEPGYQGQQPDPYQQAGQPPYQGYAPQQAARAEPYAPQFEPYQPPQAAPQEQWQPQHPASQHPQGGYYGHAPEPEPQIDPAQYATREARISQADYYRPPVPQRQAAPEPQLRGSMYDADTVASAWPPATDHYGEAQPQHGWTDAQGYQDQGGGYPPQHPAGSYGEPMGYAPPGYDPASQQPDPGFGPATGYHSPAAAPNDDHSLSAEYDPDEVAYEDDEPRGRIGLVKVAAALVIAIGLGGSLAYGYKAFVAGDGSDTPPLVRNAEVSPKEKPSDPGGRKFAHSDSKILGRLGEASAASSSSAASDESDDSAGTRKVSTMVIGRDGTIMNTASTSAPPPTTLPPSVSPVPGMTIVDGFGGRKPQVTADAPSSAGALARPTASIETPKTAAEETRQVAPTKPIVISRAEPSAPLPTQAPAVADPDPDPIPAAPKSTATSTKTTRTKTATAPVVSAPQSSGAGYVAVLASIPRSANSRMEALKRFADLQQSYSGQLGGKTPDVQGANLGAKGTYDRLIVGPPGSRQQASQLCADLKQAGYPSCWVKSY